MPEKNMIAHVSTRGGSDTEKIRDFTRRLSQEAGVTVSADERTSGILEIFWEGEISKPEVSEGLIAGEVAVFICANHIEIVEWVHRWSK